MKRYGMPQVRKFLRAIAKATPNHVYVRPDWEKDFADEWVRTGCSYVHSYDENGQFIKASELGFCAAEIKPGCIIGKMLIEDMGVDPQWFNKGHSHGDAISSLVDYLEEELDITFTTAAVELMTGVQRSQDRGKTWGRAVDEAIADPARR